MNVTKSAEHKPHHGSFANISPSDSDTKHHTLPPLKFHNDTNEGLNALIRSIAAVELKPGLPNVKSVLDILHPRTTTTVGGIDKEPLHFENMELSNKIKRLHGSIPARRHIPSNHRDPVIQPATILFTKPQSIRPPIEIPVVAVVVDEHKAKQPVARLYSPKSKNMKITLKQMAMIESEMARPIIKLENVWLRDQMYNRHADEFK